MKIAHGDIYTKEKLARFGMTIDNACPRCGNIETLTHKLIECEYTKRIMKEVVRITNTLRVNPLESDVITIEAALGVKNTSYKELTLHAEVLRRILLIREDQEYLLRPSTFVTLALEHLIEMETRHDIKIALRSLLRQ
jgi:hypothetical protein